MSLKAKILRIAAVFVAISAALTPLAFASTQDITVPIDTITRGAAGSIHTLKTVAVENGDYKLTVTSKNQHSVHPNTNIIVRSGDSTLIMRNVEREAFISETSTGTLNVSNRSVQVQLQLGEDKVSSSGLTVVLKKVIKDIEVCRPGVGVITVKETDKKSTDLAKDDSRCKDATVCRPGTGVIKIKGWERKGSDLDQNSDKCKDIEICRPGTGVIKIKGWDKKSTDLDKNSDQCKDIAVCRPTQGIVTIKGYDKKEGDLPKDDTKCKDVTVCRPKVGVITIKGWEKQQTDLGKNDAACQDVTVCRPSKGIVTIKGWDKKSTDLDKDAKECQPKPEYVNVCDTKDGKVRQVEKGKESNERHTTDLTQCDTTNVCDPETGKITSVKNYDANNFEPADSESCKEKPAPAPAPAPEPTPVVPTELPKTGLADTLMKFIGITTTTAAAVAFYRSRQ